MIRCRILGPVSVSGPDGRPLDDGLFQPRRLALLVYLAMQAPRGFTRRDAILPLFWPELDQERARGALRQALYKVRSALSEGVIMSRGLEEIAVDSALLSCDAVDFDRACDTKQWATALELYRGDFLEAFYITEAPQFEHWMHEQQSRLRIRAATAARSLAAAQEANGDLMDAVASARRAVALNSADEESLRCLLTLLDRQGDRAAAVREYDSFATRLEEYGVSPSAETRSLLSRIRQREDDLSSKAAPSPAIEPEQIPSAGSTAARDDAALVLPSSPRAAPGIAPTRGRPRVRTVAAGAAVVFLVGALLLRSALSTRLGAANLPERVVILPFDVRGEPEHAYLREAVADLLSTGLDGAGGIQTIDPNAMRAAVTSAVQPTSEDGRSIARQFDARYFVLGRVVVAGERLRVHASLYDRRTEDKLLAQSSREGAAAQLFEIVDGVAADLLVASRRVADGRMSQSAALTTRSLPAFKAYLEGERAFQTGDLSRSADALRRAVAIDSTFALASYRLSIVVDAKNGVWTEIQESAERALRHAKRLSERDHLLLEAHLASVADDVDGAERRYRAILKRHPDELEAWYRLAEVIFHQNATTGRPLTEARAPFQRLLRLDPTNRVALQHLARIAAVERRTGELDTLYRRIVALGITPAEEAETRALLVFTGGTPVERERFHDEFATARPRAFGLSSWVTAIFARDLVATERMMRASMRTPSERASSHAGIARVHAVRGRMDSAAAQLRELERLDPTLALEQGAFFAILPFRTLPDSALRAWRARVAAWRPPRADPGTMTTNDISGPWRPHIRLYLLGQLDALLRDTMAVRIDADSLELMDVPALPDATLFARELSASVRAHSLWRQGKTDAALRLLEGTRQARPYPYRGSATRTQARYVRAELLYESERFSDALLWYGTFEYTSLAQLGFATPAHLRRGQIYERLGDPPRAAAHYRQFLALWQAADVEFRPMTAMAAERLRQLRPPPS